MRGRLRTLRLGAREFRWTARLCGFADPGLDYRRCVRVRVWGGGKNGRVLRADLASVNQGPWAGVPDSSFPTPGAVRAIDDALRHGWDLRPPPGIMNCRLVPDRTFRASTSRTRVTDRRPEDGPRPRRTSCQG
jgi:hypothetical protein